MGECANGRGIVEDKDEVGQFEANLATDTCTAGRNRGGSRPGAIGKAGDNDTGTESTGSNESGLEDCEDGKALEDGRERLVEPQPVYPAIGESYLCACQNLWWNDLIGTKSLLGVHEGG